MPQVFHPSTNTIARLSIFGAIFLACGLVWLGYVVQGSPYVTEASISVDQPVPFSHKLHAGGLGLDCRFCHVFVEESATAGLPSTKTCMTCHSQVLAKSPALAPVRAGFAEDKSIEWVRVHDLPDFVHFDHSIHVRKGLECAACHGPVKTMPLVRKVEGLQMAWCLDCHRHPDRWPAAEGVATRPAVSTKRIVAGLTSCSTCHQ